MNILVTGANRGIGKEIARQLIDLGHHVIVSGRNEDALKEAAKEISAQETLVMDVGNRASVENAAKELGNKIDHLDVLINNAGVIDRQPLFDNDLDTIENVLQINFHGPLRTSLLFAPLLKANGGGKIINMSSGMGSDKEFTYDGYAGYRLSKINLNNLTRLQAVHGESHGIKSFSMCPGWVRTDMGGAGADRSVEKGAETAVWLATEENLPSGKFWRDKAVIPW